MKTRKPISTISFNSVAFLDGTLKRLLENDIIQFYAYIYHYGEDDENGKKDHIHLYIEPYNTVDTGKLEKFFIEPVFDKEKPLKCLNFRNSKIEDWYLYGLHDINYLMRKGESKVYHYKPSDMVTSDEDELRIRTHGLLTTGGTYGLYRIIDNALEQGLTPPEILASGIIPPQMIGYANLYITSKLNWLHSIAQGEPTTLDKIQAYSDGTVLLDEFDKE